MTEDEEDFEEFCFDKNHEEILFSLFKEIKRLRKENLSMRSRLDELENHSY